MSHELGTEYIRSELARGRDVQSIRHSLREAGWQEADIRAALAVAGVGADAEFAGSPWRFSAREVMRAAWRIFKEHWGVVVPALMAPTAVSFIFQILSGIVNKVFLETTTGTGFIVAVVLGIILFLAEFLLNIVIAVGSLKIVLDAASGKEPDFRDLISQYRLGFKFFFASVLAGLIILLSLIPGAIFIFTTVLDPSIFFTEGPLPEFFTSSKDILLFTIGLIITLLPAAYLSLRLSFVAYAVVDKHVRPDEAIRSSFHLTRGQVWNLIRYWLLVLAWAIPGIITLFIGSIIAFWVGAIGIAYIYRRLSSQASV